MTTGSPRFLAITGPTTSGKTELSLALGAALDVEIISMDSRQIYVGMDVGTDKVKPKARARVPHHGLDLVNPGERYSAGQFARDARRWISEIEGRGRLPLLVGGTGFFLRALTEPIFAEPPLDERRLVALRSFLRSLDAATLARWVELLDCERAPVAREGGRQRMTRTIEIALLTGRPLSWWHRSAPMEAEPVRGLIVVLDVDREAMDRSIDERVGRMVRDGLVDEVRGLHEAGFDEHAPGMTGTGYRETLAHLRGEISLEESMDRIRVNTRRYARRQITWFRHQLPSGAAHVDASLPVERQVEEVSRLWASTISPDPSDSTGRSAVEGGSA